jgi:uracil-DNA glycosylase family 4
VLLKPPLGKYKWFESCSCSGCPLEVKGQGFALPDGNGTNGVLLLGEALGAQEANSGIPFHGDAGYQLNTTLQRTRFNRVDFRIFNAVNCRPQNNWLEGAPYEHDALRYCDQYLKALVQATKPKVIAPLGNVAMYQVLGRRGIQELRGYVYEAIVHEHKCYVVPTYHPSFILRGQSNLTGVQIFDLQRAVRVSNTGHQEPQVRYVEHPAEADLALFLEEAKSAAAGGAWLSADIETPSSGSTTEDEYGTILDTDIIRIGFSFAPHTGITIRWTNANLPYIQALLQLPFPFVIFWYEEFDVPRILSKGLTIGPKVLDGLKAWHFLQSDVPAGLGFVSTFWTEMKEWKSLSDQFPEFYNICDVDSALQNTLGIKAQLEKEGRWKAFLQRVLNLNPVLVQMGKAGVRVDPDKRSVFRAQLVTEQAEIDAEMRRHVPKDCCSVHTYKKQPWPPPDHPSLFGDMAPLVVGARKSFKDGEGEKVGEWDWTEALGWHVRFPWNPNSTKQVRDYLKFKGYPVPKHHKTGEATTGKDELERLWKKHPRDPVLKAIVESREHEKMIGTYIDGFAPDPDLRVRSHFGFKPSSGRLSSDSPNMENVTNPKKYAPGTPQYERAMALRRTFVPTPGHAFVECDFKAMQAVIVGWLAKDEDYMRACRLGVHAILASYVITRKDERWQPVRVTDEDARERIKHIKGFYPDTYDDCKHVVHGSNFGGTPFKLHMDFPDSFPTVKDAEDMQKLYYGTIGRKIRQWQHDTCQLASRQCYLETPHGIRCYFWSVYQWDSRRKQMVMGPSAKDALAFQPQAIERCVMTDALQRIVARNLPDFGLVSGARVPIHDSCLFEVPLDGLGEYIGVFKEEMERADPALDGLRFEVEAAWSDTSWADMKPWED